MTDPSVDRPSADHPYVDRPVVDRDAALQVARTQAAAWGLDEPVALRHGMNALYRCGSVVLRVGRATGPAAASHELVRWLLDNGIPTVEPIDGITADLDGFAVTGWRLERETRRAIDWRVVGSVVAAVHRLPHTGVPSSYPVPSPTVFPWWDFDGLLDDVGIDIDAAALDGLRSAVERHRGWRSEVAVDPVLCHGDVHPGNVMMTGRGALLVDWDLMCVANPAWDHAMLANHHRRWGGDPAVYDAFAAGAGRSLRHDPLTAALGELRDVAATLLRVRAGRHDDAARAEAEQRLRSWRGDADAPVWRAQ